MQNFKRMSVVIALLVAMGLWTAVPAQAAPVDPGMQTQQGSTVKKHKKAKKAKKAKKHKPAAGAAMQ
ncbi:MAG: hypothetical protein H7838_04280 [Magnetococcus sp. DMHC-8]